MALSHMHSFEALCNELKFPVLAPPVVSSQSDAQHSVDVLWSVPDELKKCAT